VPFSPRNCFNLFWYIVRSGGWSSKERSHVKNLRRQTLSLKPFLLSNSKSRSILFRSCFHRSIYRFGHG
jgi:hypothetical protein